MYNTGKQRWKQIAHNISVKSTFLLDHFDVLDVNKIFNTVE